MKTKHFLLLALLLVLSHPLAAQDNWASVQDQIREEARARSRVMHTVQRITDRYGARPVGSPILEQAGQWALQQLRDWGLKNAHTEPWTWGHPGWLNERLSVHLTTPIHDALVAEAVAWTPGTDGPVTADAYYLPLPEELTERAIETYLESVGDAVRGKIVLVGRHRDVPVDFHPPALRMTDEEVLAVLGPNAAIPFETYRRTSIGAAFASLGPQLSRNASNLIDRFLRTHGALARVNDGRMHHGLIRVRANWTFEPETALPTIALRNEDYGRIVRLLDNGDRVELDLEVVNRIYPDGTTVYNYLADLPGSDKADEVIIMGAHLDSWQAATGATDNAVGVAVVMEAARILKALGTPLRRTVRVALWTGEEVGAQGSGTYVREHFGTDQQPTPDHDKLSAYLNIDFGGGRVRGAAVFGPEAAAETLRDIFSPFRDLGVLGATTTRGRDRMGSDYVSFNIAGLPSIDFLQDPLQYFTHTWHSNVDTYEHVVADDLQASAIVLAATVYRLAMRDELLPRYGKANMPPLPEGL